MNDSFRAAEVLESLDPIEIMEQQLGKRVDQFTDEEMMATMQSAMFLNSMKANVQKASGDTCMSSSVLDVERILILSGFQIGWMHSRVSEKYGYNEKEAIWCNPDGVVIYMETWNGTRLNKIEMFGEMRPERDLVNEQYSNLSRVCSGGGTYGTYPSGWDIPFDDKKFYFQADCRNGLRRRLSALNECGVYIPIWENTGRSIWMLNYDEQSRVDWMNGEHTEILKKKLSQATPMLQNIMRNFM